MTSFHFRMAKKVWHAWQSAQLPTFVRSATPKMAQLQDSPLYSNYFYTMDNKTKARYIEKLATIRNIDPYIIRKNEFIKDVAQLPTLGYVAWG